MIFGKVKEQRRPHDGVRPELGRRPKHLLSGLGVCSSGYSIIANGFSAVARTAAAAPTTGHRYEPMSSGWAPVKLERVKGIEPSS